MLLTVQMSLFTSCNDDMAAESYYTFTGEMMSDYLNSRENFSQFRRIVERAGKMEFLSSRGTRTFFPATNAGVEAYLEANGYNSVDDIPANYCDTLVRACLIESKVLYTYDMEGTQQESNELGLPLIIVTDSTVRDNDNMVVSVINSSARIINALKNDSVDNGVVHPVDQVIVPNTELGASLLEEHKEDYSIYYEALVRTKLTARLNSFRDPDYEIWKEDYPEFRTGILSGGVFSADQVGTAGNRYYARRPDHLESGFTVFLVPDEVLWTKYPQYFAKTNSPEENLQGLYNLAAERYGDPEDEEIFGLDDIDPRTGQTYKETCWNMDSLSNPHNPLYLFMSYHILDRLFESTNRMINCWGIDNNRANPTEWVGTLLDHSILKLERVYRAVDPSVEQHESYYVNHANATDYSDRVKGAIITQPANNFSMNCAYYYLDDVISYDKEVTRDVVMNTRIRMDMSTIWPEMTNNDIRLAGNPYEQYSDALDNTEASLNYYIPAGYLKNTTVSENTIFFVQRPKTEWWNMGGDEYNFLGSSYDISFRLPSVPPGQYELRMGYAGMMDRGIAQIYVGPEGGEIAPQGMPIDLRYQATSSEVGGVYGASLTDEELAENNRAMKNNGYYRGAASVFNYRGGTGSKYKMPGLTNQGDEEYDNTNPYTYRRKLCDVTVQPGVHTTLRIRSVWVQGNSGCFMIDYIELVPWSICGPGGLGEDEN